MPMCTSLQLSHYMVGSRGSQKSFELWNWTDLIGGIRCRFLAMCHYMNCLIWKLNFLICKIRITIPNSCCLWEIHESMHLLLSNCCVSSMGGNSGTEILSSTPMATQLIKGRALSPSPLLHHCYYVCKGPSVNLPHRRCSVNGHFSL